MADFGEISISEIFVKFEQGSKQGYDEFLQKLSSNYKMPKERQIDENTLCQYFKDLELYTPTLNQQYSKLFLEILKFDWLEFSPTVTEAYESLILNILSSHTGEYLNLSLHCLVKKFKPAICFERQIIGLPEVDDSTKLLDKEKFSKVHHLIGSIAKIVPSTWLHLEQVILEECPPAQFTTPYCLECYVQNLFCVTLYLPRTRHFIFQLIIKIMIEFDTIVNRSKLLETIKEQEDLTPLDVFEEFNNPQEDMTSREGKILDKLMLIFLQHIQYCCYQNEVLDLYASRQLLSELLTIFDLLLLPTQTIHTQFLYFYFCSFHPDLHELFCEHLWKQIESVNVDTMYRQAAAAFLGSYICRANYITLSQVKNHLCRMRDWILRYISNYNDSFQFCNQRHHGPFYALCQSFFYIIVFRHKELLDTHSGHKFCLSLNLQKIILSQLNPLKLCLQSIANAFCSVIRSNQIAVCDTILEKNKRTLSQEYSQFRNSEIFYIFSHFPFDPYLLKHSAIFIKELYREYDDSFLRDIEPSSVEDIEEYDLMETELPQSLPKSKPIIFDKFSPAVMDFLSYGTSPGFHHA